MHYCNYDPSLLTKKIMVPDLLHEPIYNPEKALCTMSGVLSCKAVKDKRDICCRVDLNSFGQLYIVEIASNINYLELFEFVSAKPCDSAPFYIEYTFRKVGTIE